MDAGGNRVKKMIFGPAGWSAKLNGAFLVSETGSGYLAMAVRILIADDYEDNRELLRLMLSSADYEVWEASDGQECLTRARADLPDLIMMDLTMPALDGWHVLEELRADARTSKIPCIAVTAHAETDRLRALASGFDAYVSKPFRGDELLEAVRQLLVPRVATATATNARKED